MPNASCEVGILATQENYNPCKKENYLQPSVTAQCNYLPARSMITVTILFRLATSPISAGKAKPSHG
jgi:hypothetical protein